MRLFEGANVETRNGCIIGPLSFRDGCWTTDLTDKRWNRNGHVIGDVFSDCHGIVKVLNPEAAPKVSLKDALANKTLESGMRFKNNYGAAITVYYVAVLNTWFFKHEVGISLHPVEGKSEKFLERFMEVV